MRLVLQLLTTGPQESNSCREHLSVQLVPSLPVLGSYALDCFSLKHLCAIYTHLVLVPNSMTFRPCQPGCSSH